MKNIRQLIFSGIGFAIPLAATLWLIYFIYNLLHKISKPFIINIANFLNNFYSEVNQINPETFGEILGINLLAIIIPLILLICIGLIVHGPIGKK